MDELARIGAVIADGTRAGLLTLLLDDRARTVTELARALAVAPSTASEHLSVLREAGLVTVVAQGRHRYHRLAGPEVAGWLEGLLAVPPTVALPEPRTPGDLRFARSCYDHLAGALGVAVGVRLATDAGVLLPSASGLLKGIGVDVASLASARPLTRACLDWSERRPHLAGSVGAAVLATLLDRRWLVPRSTPRALRLTASGRRALTDAWGADPAWAVL